ncbi:MULTISPECIES: DUF2946 family protein [unclassified Acidovorax]|uniref:DUF2946 family protein n=1 Tax=unclassified Acidovorax TaxID=2684926 RepID=UPI0028830B8C|nr:MULTISPECIES: DUF2946 family protein [unclassified Acidovorax]
MDDIVKQAIAKWPNVPDCYGWLGLDARGHWYMRDDATQAQGPFPQARGSRLQHDKLIDFIQRNYEADAQGRWFFQNGPQRVYVELESTPFVWRLDAGGTPVAQTGLRMPDAGECLVDEAGHVYLASSIGVGLVHTLDVELVADGIEQGRWTPQNVQFAELPQRYGFVRSPAGQNAPLPKLQA